MRVCWTGLAICKQSWSSYIGSSQWPSINGCGRRKPKHQPCDCLARAVLSPVAPTYTNPATVSPSAIPVRKETRASIHPSVFPLPVARCEHLHLQFIRTLLLPLNKDKATPHDRIGLRNSCAVPSSVWGIPTSSTTYGIPGNNRVYICTYAPGR